MVCKKNLLIAPISHIDRDRGAQRQETGSSRGTDTETGDTGSDKDTGLGDKRHKLGGKKQETRDERRGRRRTRDERQYTKYQTQGDAEKQM